MTGHVRVLGAGSRRGALFALALGSALAWGCDGPVRETPDSGGDDGGGGQDGGGTDSGLPETAPTFRNAVDLPDDELASQAVALMRADCSECHAITRQNIRHFWDISDTAWRTCFSDLEVTTQAAAQGIVDCFQDDAGLYTTNHLGVFATGADFDWFRFVFRRALGADWETEYESFRMRVLQPPAPNASFTQAEFDLLTEWFLRGTPGIEDQLPSLDGPGECTDYVDASVLALIEDGELTGWTARNREAGMLNHDCAGAATPLDCLQSYPRVTETTYGAMWETPGTEQRVLFDVPYRSSYWTKSSADGRFVANGGNDAGAGASIIDLERGVVIGAAAQYDPGFFPDNSGFMFQGTRSGPSVCMQSVLTTGSPTSIDFREPGCSGASTIGLYQHVGASLDGGDYWAVNSLWSGDPGNETVDPDVFVDPAATVSLRRLVNTGTDFEQAGTIRVDAPWQGNAVISPTMRLLVTQLANASGAPLGFVLHRIDVTRDASGGVTSIEIPEIARYCTPGGKAAFSLDDRWLVTHHRATDEDAVDLGFTGPSDPGFAAYRGVSNVYLIDLATGERHRVTNMQPGQRALFPHFRSDGWLYFLVRIGGATPEHVVASNAGFVLR